MLGTSLFCLSLLSLGAWVVLIFFRGGFWRCRERIDGPPGTLESWPPVTALVPARNEAEAIGDCVRGLVRQRYPGSFRIVVIDDHSTTAPPRRRAPRRAARRGLSVIGARALEPAGRGRAMAEAMPAGRAARYAVLPADRRSPRPL
jgi:cellulose synthase/poly-beta-1,6-N-acetylglucosamine synthase-like glycosyltransferase